jgi:hypothetical protein
MVVEIEESPQSAGRDLECGSLLPLCGTAQLAACGVAKLKSRAPTRIFASLLAPIFRGLIALVALIGCTQTPSASKLPPQIQVALSRLPSIPSGMRKSELFPYLGLKPGDDEIEGSESPPGDSYSVYEIGFGRDYILVFGERTLEKKGGRYVRVDDGRIYDVEIKRRKGAENGHPVYERLPGGSKSLTP